MKKTINYNLLKPEKNDFYNIDDFNQNADIVDQELKKVDKKVDDAVIQIRGEIANIDLSEIHDSIDKKVDKVAGKGLSTNDFTNVDKQQIATNKQDITTLQSGKESLIKNAPIKTTIADADTIPLSDHSVASATKKITWANLRTVMKAYFDGLYNKYSHPTYTPRSAGLYKVTVDGTGHVSATAAVQKADITSLGIPAQDTVYTHPTTAGNKHIPAGGSANQVLQWDSAGTAKWGVASDKKQSTFVIGTTRRGHKAAEVDYLCDGTADQEEINAAIAALPSAGGKIVIREGTYYITETINVNRNNVTLEGIGKSSVLRRMFSGAGLISVTSSNNTIQALMIDGNRASYIDVNNHNIHINGNNDNTITGITSNSARISGILVENSNNNIISMNTCKSNYINGICLQNSNNNTISMNICNACAVGINIGGSTNTITGNTCYDNNTGIEFGDSSINTVTGNTCNNNEYHGITFSDSNINTITGNTCCNNFYSGIYFSAFCNANTITGNTCYDNNTGIEFYRDDVTNNTVTGNTIIRGTGLPTDYTDIQHTIFDNSRNSVIACNNIMGKNRTNGGVNNTYVNNKFT